MKIWLLFIAIFLLGSHSSISQNKFQIVLKNENGAIDLCGSSFKKEVLLTINLGKIETKDSLLGYNFKIKYDTSKISFKAGLKVNTLSAFFDEANTSISRFEQGLFGYGGQIKNLFNPIVGNLPLVAFTGEYISDCNDSTKIEVEYFEFTDEFTKKLDLDSPYVNVQVFGGIEDRPERKMVFNFPKDTLEMKADTVYEESINFTTFANSNANSVFISFKVDDPRVVIKDVKEFSSDLKVKSFIYQNGQYNLEIDNGSLGTRKDLKIQFTTNVDEDINTKIYSKSAVLTNCTCVTQYVEDSLIVVVKKKPINSIENGIDDLNLNKIEIYNYMGLLVGEVESKEEFKNLQNGLYFLKYTDKNITKNLQKLIINN